MCGGLATLEYLSCSLRHSLLVFCRDTKTLFAAFGPTLKSWHNLYKNSHMTEIIHFLGVFWGVTDSFLHHFLKAPGGYDSVFTIWCERCKIRVQKWQGLWSACSQNSEDFGNASLPSLKGRLSQCTAMWVGCYFNLWCCREYLGE